MASFNPSIFLGFYRSCCVCFWRGSSCFPAFIISDCSFDDKWCPVEITFQRISIFFQNLSNFRSKVSTSYTDVMVLSYSEVMVLKGCQESKCSRFFFWKTSVFGHSIFKLPTQEISLQAMILSLCQLGRAPFRICVTRVKRLNWLFNTMSNFFPWLISKWDEQSPSPRYIGDVGCYFSLHIYNKQEKLFIQ